MTTLRLKISAFTALILILATAIIFGVFQRTKETTPAANLQVSGHIRF